MSKQKVIITEHLAADLESLLVTLKYDKLFILTDTNTHEKCYPLLKNVPQIEKSTAITIKAGDTHKSLEQLSAVWQTLSSERASRHSLLINLGGGMVTDLGGFAAATFKRGLRTINIPTTLMASVDAAVGGKTGINFNGLKNEIGSFHLPECVLIDCSFLRTLDTDNLLSGYAEMIKHALLSSPDIYKSILSLDLTSAIDYAVLNQMVAQSVAVKDRIVEEDPKEHGIRKALNLGHTIGHAIESLSFKEKRPLLHGHAVALGLICELYLSLRLCAFPKERLIELASYIKEYYPPFAYNCNNYGTLLELMTHDKKNEDGIINFTLLSDIGQIRINQSANKTQIEESLDFYRDFFGL